MSADLDGQARGNAKLGLARAYGAWYNIYHQLEQLELAISNGEDALKLCAESGWRSIAALDDLAQLYRHRFERLQNYDDASKGIKYIREAINMLRGFAGKNNLNHEAECLSSLSKLLRARAEAYHAEEDLNNAVRAEHDALQITDAEHKEYTPRAVDLSYNLTARFRVIGNLEDLNEADNILNVASQNLKLRRIPATSRELSLVENQHGIVSVCRWQAEGDNKWVREGLTYFKTAAAIDPSSLAFSQNYASAVTSLARHSGELIDAITAVKAFLTYVENIEKYAPETAEKNLPLVLEKLARLYVDKMKTENNKAMWTPMCVRLLEQLCQANKAQVGVRLWAAGERSAMAAWREDDFEAASRFISLAVSLLPELLNPGLNRVDQLRLIKNNSNLPGFTLAFHIMAGHKISEALQRFEQARGVLWNRLLRESDELDSLNEIDQELAKQFRESHTRLLAPRKPLVSLENDTSMVFNAADSYADALEYNTLLTKIRLQPGLENFLLLPADPAELSSYADDGAIVVINCAHNYSHAIIVTSLETAVLKLPDYSEKSAKRLYEMMKSALDCLKQQDETSATKLFEELCTALWNSIAKPVLDKLDEVLPQDSIRQWNSKPVHRIWWLANQWINVLPIHAAGDYSCRSISDEARSVLDRAISSYIPSFGALKFARKNDTAKRLSTSSSQVRDQPSALIISMPSTPGQTSLPNATKEVNTITEQLALSNIAVTNLAEDSATKKSITSALKTASVAHFVCHGLVDPTDPLKSQLVHTDSHRNPLDVRTLIRTQMPACTLVYLSVCNAAASETLPLVDEGLHIAGGFLMAGVPQVIATQWELADQLGVQVAERFYAHLVDGGEGGVGDSNDPAAAVAGLDVSHSAEALRDVLLTIRADGVPGILYGAYVHYGV